MEDGLKDRFVRGLTSALVLLVLAGGIVFAYPAWRRSQALAEQDAELQARIDAKKREIARLVESQRRFKTDPDFVETIARRNHRVFPGELVFIFEDR